MTREEENQLIFIAARWEAVCDVLDGEEVSDFMMSFPEVRRVRDFVELQKGKKYSPRWTPDPHDDDIMRAK